MNLQSRVRGDKTDHRWRMLLHLDGCHYYTSAYRCADCGASYSFHAERDLSQDPYSAVWMEPRIDDDGNEVACARCEELHAGAVPRVDEEYVAA